MYKEPVPVAMTKKSDVFKKKEYRELPEEQNESFLYEQELSTEKQNSKKPGPQISKSGLFFNPHNQENKTLQRLFDILDVENRGKIRSYDVYLSTLRPDQKNLVHEILEEVDKDGMFVSMDFDMFERIVKRSGRIQEVKEVFD